MNKLALKLPDIKAACAMIAAAPAQRAAHAVARAKATQTPGRYQQRRLTAGAEAIAEVMFRVYPELQGKFSNLTKAIRRGMGEGVKFDELNELGAQALGLGKAPKAR